MTFPLAHAHPETAALGLDLGVRFNLRVNRIGAVTALAVVPCWSRRGSALVLRARPGL